MASSGSVQEWHQDQGWGIIESSDTPGGASVRSSVIRAEGVADLGGGFPFLGLRPGTAVQFTWTTADSRVHGCDYAVQSVWPTTAAVPVQRPDQPYSGSAWDSFGFAGTDGLTTMRESTFDDEDLIPVPTGTLPRTTGTVRTWEGEEGWGVLDSDDTPGGAWAHFSEVAGTGFRTLIPGQTVDFDYENHGQDGFDYRANNIQSKNM